MDFDCHLNAVNLILQARNEAISVASCITEVYDAAEDGNGNTCGLSMLRPSSDAWVEPVARDSTIFGD
jgi:hypothetical protein